MKYVIIESFFLGRPINIIKALIPVVILCWTGGDKLLFQVMIISSQTHRKKILG